MTGSAQRPGCDVRCDGGSQERATRWRKSLADVIRRSGQPPAVAPGSERAINSIGRYPASSASVARPSFSSPMSDPSSPPPAPPDASLPPPPPATGSPTDFLKGVVGKRVVVRLTSGIDYRGLLSCLDGYMNIALEQTEEHVSGTLTNCYGDTFVRGNNVLYISAAESL
ncbi:hypothetical protein FOMPIDRAFT_95978 [Fomitopsis schrenkii]|uniref:U6 snRNA-associated Sm-like protein LSm6 n=1 Tax=Fomitopsis schrenkii TaxID=2126942 RepID=S8DLG8_FOMSC|nr:hypothetical protein FOMPIDRAFT_95978 [Fomitopsis schrenkii]